MVGALGAVENIHSVLLILRSSIGDLFGRRIGVRVADARLRAENGDTIAVPESEEEGYRSCKYHIASDLVKKAGLPSNYRRIL